MSTCVQNRPAVLQDCSRVGFPMRCKVIAGEIARFKITGEEKGAKKSPGDVYIRKRDLL